MRPDALQQAHTPFMDELIATGASTLTARTVMPSITLPCITSLFMSAPPQEHGVTSNIWNPDNVGTGLMDVVGRAGGKAASFYNWEQLRDLSRPGALHTGIYLNNCHEPEGAGDAELAQVAVEALKDKSVDFAFIYLGYTDVAGHDHGWMTDPYLQAIENADICIRRVVDGLRNGSTEDCLVVITSDHGGHETHHGTDMDVDMTTPIILHGDPAITPGTTLTGPISIIDIAPTITRWLGLQAPPDWRGQAISYTVGKD
jgi:predicted AlkP superfamily pyrophosphatase or phosphodiesterase